MVRLMPRERFFTTTYGPSGNFVCRVVCKFSEYVHAVDQVSVRTLQFGSAVVPLRVF